MLDGGLELESRGGRLELGPHLAAGPDVEADRRDPDRAMSELRKMLDRVADAASQVGERRVSGDPGDLAVDQHDRPRDRGEQIGETGVAVVDEREHQGVDPACAKRLEREPLAGDVPARADDHQADVHTPQVLLDHLGDAAEDVVIDRRQEEADERAPRRSQPPGRRVCAEVESRDGLEHLRPRLGRDVRRVVEDARHGRLRNARLARDIEDRRLADDRREPRGS